MNLAPFDFQNENYHLGHLFMDTLKSRPDAVCQLDAATGESETNASVLKRSIQLARCFRNFGLKPGDILALGGRNHLDLHIPYYAALLNGMPISGVDPQFKYNQLRALFKICSPRVAFCQKELLEDHLKLIEELELNTKVICFDEGEHSLATFIQQYDDKEPTEDFFPAIFDLNKIYLWLVSTGGTTGVLKLAAIKHKSFLKKLGSLKALFSKASNKDTSSNQNTIGINISPVQWISAFFCAVSMPLLGQIKIQSSAPHTTEHIIDIINKYRPKSIFLGPYILTAILKSEKKCDFTCFDSILVSGAKIHEDLIMQLRQRNPKAEIMEIYGQTENLGHILINDVNGPIGSCGKPSPYLNVLKLVDPETGKEITEPNVPGELWTETTSFSEYYNNPEATKDAFSEDGWFKTGDILYRDENGYFFFVERLKMLIKFRRYHVIPPEIEAVIREHPSVLEVSVTSIPDREDGEHPVACLETKPGCSVTAQEIKDLVANKLSDSHKLRGGVVFMKLPLTSSGKIERGKLREIVLTAHRE